MQYSRYSHRSPSGSSTASSEQNSSHRFKTPALDDYEYLGRLVTRERPKIRKSHPVRQNVVYPQNKTKYQHSSASHHQEAYEPMPSVSSSDGIDDADGLNKPLGIIRITDRHFREIYRLPTPPPKIKRVYHRLQSPEPKVIERVFVRRPPPQIIENIIEVPPEKVRIINREKYLGKSTPITRSKLVHLQSRDQHNLGEDEGKRHGENTHLSSKQYAFNTASISSDPYFQQQHQTTTAPLNTSQQSQASLVYPPQSDLRTVGYFESTIPPHLMFNSQQPFQLSSQQLSSQPPADTSSVQQTSNYPPAQTTTYPSIPQHQQPMNTSMVQSSGYTFPAQQSMGTTMVQPTSFMQPAQQFTNYQTMQPTSFMHPTQQFFSPQAMQSTPFSYPSQAMQSTPFSYPSQTMMPNTPYGQHQF